MANPLKSGFLSDLTKRFGLPAKLTHSESLYDIPDCGIRIYIRYSKKHTRNQTFYGLRKVDLQCLEGRPSLLCFLWDGQREPLFVPFNEFEEIFASLTPAGDGQYKVQVYEKSDGSELYIANAGRFNAESYFGWAAFQQAIQSSSIPTPVLTHAQVQALLGSIGAAKGFDVWIPPNNRANLDWSLTTPFVLSALLPPSLSPIRQIVEEIDVIWAERGGSHARAFFEVEHTTPIYSGLLRFNDVHLLLPDSTVRFNIVSQDDKRSLFVKQLGRPTFRASTYLCKSA